MWLLAFCIRQIPYSICYIPAPIITVVILTL